MWFRWGIVACPVNSYCTANDEYEFCCENGYVYICIAACKKAVSGVVVCQSLRVLTRVILFIDIRVMSPSNVRCRPSS